MKSEAQHRIEAARERIAKVGRAREIEAEKRREADELASLEREAALCEALAEAEAKHGPLGRKVLVVHATLPDDFIAGSVIVKVASPMEWSKFRGKLATAKGIEIDHAQEALWRGNVVFPDLGTVDRLVAELPFLSTALADAVGRLCGVRSEDLTGKSTP